jgi:hypothetical protein
MIDDLPTRYFYTANGVQTAFAYPTPLFVASDLEVYVDGVLQVTGYTVTLETDNSLPADIANPVTSALVTFTTAPANAAVVALILNVPLEQDTDYSPFARFPADQHERSLDRLYLALQAVRDVQAYAVLAGANTEAAPSTPVILPSEVDRADKLLGFDSNGAAVPGPSATDLQALIDAAEGVLANSVATAVSYSGPDLVGANVDAALDDAGARIVALEAIPSLGTASESAQGVIELATQVEADAGTDDARAMTPLKAARAQEVRVAASTGGTANAITATFSPTITAYTTGMVIVFVPSAANTTTNPTINVDGLGAKTIKTLNAALTPGNIAASQPAVLRYDGTDFMLMNPVFAPGTPATQAYVAGSTLTFAHGLGVTPRRVDCYMVNVTGEHGFTANQRILANPHSYVNGTIDRGFTVRVDATNVYIYLGQEGVNIISTTYGSNTLTNNYWNFGVYAYA